MIKTIRLAAEHFDLPMNEVTPKHVDFIKEQLRVKNYNNMGVPLRSYFVLSNGIVEFTKPILNDLELQVS